MRTHLRGCLLALGLSAVAGWMFQACGGEPFSDAASFDVAGSGGQPYAPPDASSIGGGYSGPPEAGTLPSSIKCSPAYCFPYAGELFCMPVMCELPSLGVPSPKE